MDWHLIKTLARTAPLIHPAPTAGGFFKRAKYCLRGVAFAGCTRAWLELLGAPELAIAVKNHSFLYHKLQRPYLNRTLDTRERLEALKNHYTFVKTRLCGPIIKEIFAPAGMCLALVPFENPGNFCLRLRCSRREREGDLSISLADHISGAELFTLAFSVWKYKLACKEIFVGGLQGTPATNKDLVISLTRGLHGMRPKALLLFALQELADSWGITSLRAVSDDLHVYRHFDRRLTFSASYDDFWIESGGRPSADGLIDLPALFVPRDISEIKVNKRKMYKRRYAMLGEIAEQIRVTMSRVGNTLAPSATRLQSGITWSPVTHHKRADMPAL
jgi:uncharacterized protein VirK/YbjX